MAGSVLGKRQRRTNDSEVELVPIQSRKRRSHISAPQIHDEDGDLAVPDHLEDPQSKDVDGSLYGLNGFSKSRVVSTKRTVPDTYKFSHRKSSTCIETSSVVTDENALPTEFKTPSTVRFRDALAPITPKRRVKISGKPLTPRTSRTGLSPSSTRTTVYATARQLFAHSGASTRLIGRDEERAEVADFVSDAVRSRRGGAMYVSGPPGTGKSALVEEVTKDLSTTISNLRLSVVNCVGSMSSKDVLQKIILDVCPDARQVTRSEQSVLSKLFLPRKKNSSDSFLVILDEVDNLLSVDSEALYTLFDLALHKSSRLILIGIANALDLTDRFLPRLKARNLRPRLLPFMPYTATQIASIVTAKLRSTLPENCTGAAKYVPFLHPAAIQLCSKKVASQTGDLRKAFNIVRRAIDSIERESVETYTATECTPTKPPFGDITNTSPTKLLLSPPLSSPLRQTSSSSIPSMAPTALDNLTAENAPRATVAHVARLTATIFNNDVVSRLDGLNLQQKAVMCSLVAAEKTKPERDPFQTPSKTANRKPMLKDLFQSYAGLCKQENVLCPLSATEFRDVVSSLDTLGLVQEANVRPSYLTPTKTPSRISGRRVEDKQFMSSVTQKELEEHLRGPGSDILKTLLYGEPV